MLNRSFHAACGGPIPRSAELGALGVQSVTAHPGSLRYFLWLNTRRAGSLPGAPAKRMTQSTLDLILDFLSTKGLHQAEAALRSEVAASGLTADASSRLERLVAHANVSGRGSGGGAGDAPDAPAPLVAPPDTDGTPPRFHDPDDDPDVDEWEDDEDLGYEKEASAGAPSTDRLAAAGARSPRSSRSSRSSRCSNPRSVSSPSGHSAAGSACSSGEGRGRQRQRQRQRQRGRGRGRVRSFLCRARAAGCSAARGRAVEGVQRGGGSGN